MSAPVWPFNRNHEAARRHVNQILRDHGRPDYSRRETHVAELLDELVRERNELRDIVYRGDREQAIDWPVLSPDDCAVLIASGRLVGVRVRPELVSHA